jgi:phospholipid transport system substrate-binding protein
MAYHLARRLLLLTGMLLAWEASGEPLPAAEESAGSKVLLQVRRAAGELARAGGTEPGPALQVIGRSFDVSGIAQAVLGQTWSAATPPERAAFSDYLTGAIARGLAERLGQVADSQFRVTASQRLANGDLVITTHVSAGLARVVHWRFRRGAGSPRIVDVLVDGRSVTATQRAEYAATLRENGGSLTALIATLRARGQAGTP